jgi:hypothetical protein
MAGKIVDIASVRLRKRARGGKIVLAPQADISRFEPELIDDFLDRVFQAGDALVTDWTRLSDFVSFGSDPHESARAVARIRAVYGIDVDIHDRLVDVLGRVTPRE